MSTLAQLYDTHSPALYAYLLSLTRNEPDTLDLLQEVFARIARRPELLAPVQDHRSFLLRMAHNLAMDLIRYRAAYAGALGRFNQEPIELFETDPSPEVNAFAAALASAMAELPEEQRAVVQLKLWENMTFAAIAEMLLIPVNTAASRYRYAIEKLRALLRPLSEP
jgi:RNA polymerase sigma-70 factor, ECF subfamily